MEGELWIWQQNIANIPLHVDIQLQKATEYGISILLLQDPPQMLKEKSTYKNWTIMARKVNNTDIHAIIMIVPQICCQELTSYWGRVADALITWKHQTVGLALVYVQSVSGLRMEDLHRFLQIHSSLQDC